MKTTKQLIAEYESQGGAVKYRIDKDGHVRVYSIDGQTFKSRQGASVLRARMGEPLSAAAYEIRRRGSETISTLASSGYSVQSEKTLTKWKKIREIKAIKGPKAKVARAPKAKATKALPRLTKKEELLRKRINRRLKKEGKTERLKARTLRKRKLEEREKRQMGEKSERLSTIAKRTERYRLGYAYTANVKAFVEYIGGQFSPGGKGLRLMGADDVYNKFGQEYNFLRFARSIWSNREIVMDHQLKEGYQIMYGFFQGSVSGKDTEEKLYLYFGIA